MKYCITSPFGVSPSLSLIRHPSISLTRSPPIPFLEIGYISPHVISLSQPSTGKTKPVVHICLAPSRICTSLTIPASSSVLECDQRDGGRNSGDDGFIGSRCLLPHSPSFLITSIVSYIRRQVNCLFLGVVWLPGSCCLLCMRLPDRFSPW